MRLYNNLDEFGGSQEKSRFRGGIDIKYMPCLCIIYKQVLLKRNEENKTRQKTGKRFTI